MKRLFLLFLVFLLIPVPDAKAADAIYLLASPQRDVTGRFASNELANLIAPSGELGITVFRNLPNASDLYIDVSLIEEVSDLVDGYIYLDEAGAEVTVAESIEANRWLAALKLGAANKRVFALPYGNPDRAFLIDNAPAEYRFYQGLAQSRLSGFLGKGVEAADSHSAVDSKSSDIAREMHSANRSILRKIYRSVPAPEVAVLRLELGKILNPGLSAEQATSFIGPLRKSINQMENGIRITSGNYTITAAEYDLPITVINDFSIPATIKLRVRPNNSRVVIGALEQVSIPARSQLQVELPIKVIASGQTDLEITMRSIGARLIGNPVIIPLRLAVISPVTTWFTTGMAIILLLAAVIQSVRRVKRRKKHE